jgi:flagellar FliL protein
VGHGGSPKPGAKESAVATEAAETDLPDAAALPPEEKAGRRWLAILAAAVLFLTGSVGGAFVTGLLDPLIGALGEAREAAEEAAAPSGPPVYFEMPEMMVDLKPGRRRREFIKVAVVIELAEEEDKLRLQEFQPRILDSFQSYLRDQARADLVGKAGAERVRLEFLTVVNDHMAPARARNVLFNKILLQ